VRLDHLLSREPTASAVHSHPFSPHQFATHDSGVKAPLAQPHLGSPERVAVADVPFQVQPRGVYHADVFHFLCPRGRRDDVRRAALRPAHVGGQGRHYAHMVDASARRADEGRGRAAISVGESRADRDPTISEWGNPTASAVTPVTGEGTGGTEPSNVPRGRESIPVVVASEPGTAQTVVVPSRQALRRRGCRTDHGVLPRAR
jgi:hypothetical protein